MKNEAITNMSVLRIDSEITDDGIRSLIVRENNDRMILNSMQMTKVKRKRHYFRTLYEESILLC